MLTLRNSVALELRGIAEKTSRQGKTYYTINVESADGTPYGLYCPDASALPPQGTLKKGDNVVVTFDVSYYKGAEKLTVTKLQKAASN